METINDKKIGLVILKEDIINLENEQRFLKNQRKTVNLVGERKLPSWKANYKHWRNRRQLRVMYAAYGLARGKCYSEIESHYPEQNHPLTEFELKSWINQIMKDYELNKEE